MRPGEERRPVPNRDLSKQAGNPTSELQAHYQRLMSIQDPVELADAAVQVVEPLVGKAMSVDNYNKFLTRLKQAGQRGLVGVQKYVSDFILRGSGLGVVEDVTSAIASVITEDVDDPIELTRHQRQLKALVESNTKFHVVLLPY